MAKVAEDQMQRFSREGCLVVEDVLDPSRDIRPILQEYEEIVENVAQLLFSRGKTKSSYPELPLLDRLLELHAESGEDLSRYFDISLPERNVAADTPLHVSEAVFRLLTNPSLLDVVESILGPEIYVHPLQRVRIKLPERIVRHDDFGGLTAPTPWHQDNGVLLPEADYTDLVTVWVPLNEATAENGALEVIPKSHHLFDQVLLHQVSPTVGPYIPDSVLPTDKPVTVPMQPGQVLLLHRRIVHRSRPNTTPDQIRLSFDLRYQPIGQPTGRPQYPGFVARSLRSPDNVLRDTRTWADLWLEARARTARGDTRPFFRWESDPSGGS